MGSFNASCIVSGLPIEGGDKVRFLVLARSSSHPDGNEHVNYVDGRWKLFGVPVRGEYNDYGSVENTEGGYAEGFLFAALRAHAVERGVGDNSCHDLEVVAGMGKESWLKALWEGRVRVRECHPRAVDGESTWEPPVGVPTFKRVKALLTASGHPLQSRDQEEPYVDGFLVDEASPGFVRLRAGGYGGELKVESLLPVLHEAGYAAMMVAGSGFYAESEELLVGPLPPKDGVHVVVQPFGSEEELPNTMIVRPASQAMIREDVWQLLLSLPGWAGKTVEDMRAAAVSAYEEDVGGLLEKEDDIDEEVERLTRMARRALGDRGEGPLNFFREAIREGRIGTAGFGLQDAFDAAKDSQLDPEKAKKFVSDIAETAFAQFAYGSLHGQWQPRTNGSQDPNWEGHHGFLLRLASLAESRLDEE